MHPISDVAVCAFWHELEKIAAGPHMIEVDDPNIGSRFFQRADLDRQLASSPPEVRAAWQQQWPDALTTKKDVVIVSSKKALRAMNIPEQNIDTMHRVARRHELAHWQRARRGKFKGVGKPGLRNVLRSYREEAVAHTNQLPKRNVPADLKRRAAEQWLTATHASVKQGIYPQGVRKAALGGKLGKALRVMRLVR